MTKLTVEDDSSSVLADTSLNAFGLIVIVLITFLITTISKSGTSSVIAEVMPDLSEKVEKADEQISLLEKELKQSGKSNKTSGLWKFRVQVDRLVSSRGVKKVDFIVEYYVWMLIENQKVRGRMFGAKKVAGNSKTEIVSQARLTGIVNDELRLNFEYRDGRVTGTEILEAKLHNDQYVGLLRSGKPTANDCFEGTVIGTRLDDSDFRPEEL